MRYIRKIDLREGDQFKGQQSGNRKADWKRYDHLLCEEYIAGNAQSLHYEKI